jgi:nucleotide-binding universal stress UspA family protein
MSTQTTTDPARPGSIVVGFDDSPQSHAALHWAAAEAKSRGARLRIVNAWDPSPITPWNLPEVAEWREQAATDAQKAAEAARAAVGGGLDAEAVAIEGSPGQVLAEESRSADLVVVGSAGHVGLVGLLAGSVSRHLLHRAACPLVVLGPNAASDPTRRLVLSPTLDPAGETFDWVARWVERRAVPLYVVASFDITTSIADLQLDDAQKDIRGAVYEQTRRWVASLEDVVRQRAVIPLEIDQAVIEGPGRQVLDRATEPGDLLVVPAGCEHSVPVARGECPIAVVPAVRRERVAEPAATVVAVSPAVATTRITGEAAGVL